MNLLDTYYRAYREYRKYTENDKILKKNRKSLGKPDDNDKFNITKYTCTIDEEWVIQIEKGLEFVERAVKEERQFIRTNGEVVPIEKAKKISRDSVVHLASHSNLISHAPKNPNDTIVPDSIYMVEKLNDYAVYENRFLYMLLCYLRDFIQLRLDKINELRMTYICDFSIVRTEKNKRVTKIYETKYYENRTDNPYPLENKISDEILTRIENCQQIVMMLLNTNLMSEVSKAPMVKPPIVKTNVLKMNNNFKNSLALYDYIVNYSGDGFEKKEVNINLVPLNDDISDEMFELPLLMSFLTYKHGNNLEKILKQAYDDEEDRRRKEENDKLLAEIKKMKKKIEESGMGIEEYLVLLEKRNKILERDSQDLILAKNEIINLNKKIDDLMLVIEEHKRHIKDLELIIENKDKEIAYLNKKYIEDMAELRRQHALEIEKLNEEHQEEIKKQEDMYLEKLDEQKEYYESEINALNLKHESEIIELEDNHKNEIQRLNEEHYNKLESITKLHQEELTNLNNEIEALHNELDSAKNEYKNNSDALNSKLSSLQNDYTQMVDSYEEKLKKMESDCSTLISTANIETNLKLNEMQKKLEQAMYDRRLMAAMLRGIRSEYKLIKPNDELTSKERFEELEEEFEAFNTFFKEQWRLTKKSIRRKLLWTKEEKKNKKTSTNFSSNTSDLIDLNVQEADTNASNLNSKAESYEEMQASSDDNASLNDDSLNVVDKSLEKENEKVNENN